MFLHIKGFQRIHHFFFSGLLFILALLGCSQSYAAPRYQPNRMKSEMFQNPPPEWMLKQIHTDLESFSKSSISTEILDRVMLEENAIGNPHFLVRYKITNNKVQVISFVSHDRIPLVTKSIKQLAQSVKLPNVDFIVTMHDSLDGTEFLCPIFSFAKRPKLSPQIILMPDFEALLGNFPTLLAVDKGNQSYPWDKKVNKAIWKGAMTGGIFTPENFLDFPRTKTITQSLQYPDLIDAGYTALVQCENCELIKSRFSQYFGPSSPVEDHIKYKYQLLIDGNTCAYSRAYWQLFSNCVILKQSSDAIQWYYGALQPYEHYIPVKADMSDLIDVIKWAIEHDDEVEKISLRAQEFSMKNLRHTHVMQYLYLLLEEYSRLQNKS